MHWLAHLLGSRHERQDEGTTPETQGLVLTWAWRYDLLVWWVTRGKERAFRQMTVEPAQLQPGETVLDVGCGTGSLALVAKERVGATGRVCGIDASVQMIARARRKAERVGLSIDFQVGLIEQLAFPDQSFDVVLSTMMMHHLPDDLKRQGLAEMARVLKPEGRLLVVDLKGTAAPHGRLEQPAQTGTGESGMHGLSALMQAAGMFPVETGAIRFAGFGKRVPELGFVRAQKS